MAQGESVARRDGCLVLLHVLLRFTHCPQLGWKRGVMPGTPPHPAPGAITLHGTAATAAYASSGLTLPQPTRAKSPRSTQLVTSATFN